MLPAESAEQEPGLHAAGLEAPGQSCAGTKRHEPHTDLERRETPRNARITHVAHPKGWAAEPPEPVRELGRAAGPQGGAGKAAAFLGTDETRVEINIKKYY